jgi:hypothetical protein
VDPRFDQDKAELGILVFPVNFKVLAHGNRLFDEVPKVLRDGWAKSYPQTKGKCRKDVLVERRSIFERKGNVYEHI